MFKFQAKAQEKKLRTALYEECGVGLSAEQERELVKAQRKAGRYYRDTFNHVLISCKLMGDRRSRDPFDHPRLMSVDTNGSTDRLVIRMSRGQSPQAYFKAAENLAHSWQAISCKVATDIIPPLPIPDHPNLDALAIGKREDGQPWTVSLKATHWICGGASGSGKASWQWSVIRSILALIEDGTVQIWAADPKQMEMAMGRSIFHRYASDPEDIADMLETAVDDMRKRAALLSGRVRTHVPSKDEAMVILMVDEAGYLNAYLGDTKLQGRIKSALSTLITQGRAISYIVVLAQQDVRKEALPHRSLIQSRVALRLDDELQPDMLLGSGMRARGGLADQIPISMPGVAFVKEEHSAEPIRVRASMITDDDIREMAERVERSRESSGQ
jgi:S-DNA-T family DNA segregation ATPase FtsK/SpoIIIE